MSRKPKQPAPTYYTPPSIIMDIQSARAQDAISTPSKRLEILLINPPLSARKRRQRTQKTTQNQTNQNQKGGKMSNPIQTQTCKTCKYYEWAGMNAVCRRFPPQVYIQQRDRRDAFPMVGIDDWCGEWKAKEEK